MCFAAGLTPESPCQLRLLQLPVCCGSFFGQQSSVAVPVREHVGAFSPAPEHPASERRDPDVAEPNTPPNVLCVKHPRYSPSKGSALSSLPPRLGPWRCCCCCLGLCLGARAAGPCSEWNPPAASSSGSALGGTGTSLWRGQMT